jgi:glycosyltransferase involved in cell wall biosynthesis
MKILALCTYPVEAAVTRFRVAQLIPELAKHSVDVDFRPFLDAKTFRTMYDVQQRTRTAFGILRALLRRLVELPRLRRYDALFLQTQAMLIGPPIAEWFITQSNGVPMVLDLDDATYLPSPGSPYGRVATIFKCGWKTDWLIDRARIVICGNDRIAAHVESRGRRSVVMPTLVDVNLFRPRPDQEASAEVPVIGWIGTHSTFPYLQAIFPVLERLAEAHQFRLRVVGSAQKEIRIKGVTVENLPWSLDREVADFQSLDVGLYPLAEDDWATSKSGLKAIQYLSCGVPYVVTPVGITSSIGVQGVTHLEARTADDWYGALSRLLSDESLRRAMGAAGREYAEKTFSVAARGAHIAGILEEAARGRALPGDSNGR